MGKVESPHCDHCDNERDTAEHTLFHCPRWSLCRVGLKEETNGSLEPEHIMAKMISSKRSWNRIAEIMTEIMKKKEEEERKLEREAAVNRNGENEREAAIGRRGRRRRRRNPFLLQ